MKSVLFAMFALGQAAALLAAGVTTLWFSGDLMVWLLSGVGEERALGQGNVIRLENGAILLTNPGLMIAWTLPFWFLGILQITSALTLAGLWLGRGRGRVTAEKTGCIRP